MCFGTVAPRPAHCSPLVETVQCSQYTTPLAWLLEQSSRNPHICRRPLRPSTHFRNVVMSSSIEMSSFVGGSYTFVEAHSRASSRPSGVNALTGALQTFVVTPSVPRSAGPSQPGNSYGPAGTHPCAPVH